MSMMVDTSVMMMDRDGCDVVMMMTNEWRHVLSFLPS